MKFYSFDNLVFLVDNVPISGFAQGDDVIKGARRQDAFSDVVGTDGEMTINQNLDQSGELSIRLMETSDSHAMLSAKFNVAEKHVFSAVSILVKDIVSGEQVGGSKGYIKRPADMSKGTQATPREWSFVVEKYSALLEEVPEA